jgi:hypothetical protein
VGCLVRFDRWLSDGRAGPFTDPLDVLGDPGQAVGQAAAFRRWTADPANRLTRRAEQRFAEQPVHPRLVNDDLRAVAELFAFVAANPAEARQVLGPHPWSRVTDAHAAGWFSPASRISGNSTTSTTSTTTHSRRSPRRCPCSDSAATSRC